MAKYLKEFQTVAQYNAAKDSFLLPHISTIIETSGITYEPQLPIKNAVITCDSATYNGETQIATNIVVVVDGKTLVSGTDYTVSGNTSGINAGNYTFTINGINNYVGSKNGVFTINKVAPTVVIPVAKVLTYQKGVAQQLVTAGSTNYGTMKYSTDGETYSTTVPSKTKAGSYTVYYFVEGNSNVNSTDVATVACSINEKPVTATIELSQDTYTYDGSAKEPTVTVKDGGDVIDPSEYTATYSNNTNAGTASVTITDNTAGDYNVSGVTTFTINKASRTMSWVSSPSDVISGSSITVEAAPSVGVGDGIITYSSSDTTKATVNGNIVSGAGVGSCTITANISEGTNYLSASTSYSLTVSDYRVVAKFNVTDTSNPTQIVGSKYGSPRTSGFSEIEIDGVKQSSVVSAYTFSATGEHTVKYTLTDPTSIGESDFGSCTSLTSIDIPNSVTSIGDYAFYYCTSLTSIDIPNSVTSIGSEAFNGCKSLTSIDIPDSVTDIGTYVFQVCEGLTSCTIGSGVTGISYALFRGCFSLTSVVMPNSVTYISGLAFQFCRSLTSIDIPNSVTNIGEYAFQNCTSLTSCTIGSGVTSIVNEAFLGCSGLTSIVSNATTAPTIYSSTFQDVHTDGTLTVPSGSSGYDVWMGTGDYYLGKYGWTKVEQ